MIALVTDSNAQLPPELVERYGVTVVPLGVTIDGECFLEGVDLDADDFYARFAGGARPEVSTTQPSPGRFAAVFEELAEHGAEEVLAVHVGSSISGTVNSARLGAEAVDVAVRVVDTATASFGVACCVWEAGEVLARGGSSEEAAAVAVEVGARVRTIFTVGALDLARSGGRLAAGPADAGAEVAGAGIPVLTMDGGAMQVVAQVGDVEEAVEAMAAAVVAAGSGLRAAVGVADVGAAPMAQMLQARLAEADEVREVVAYRIGPSVGAHTGPGTAGVYFYRSG